MNKTILWVGVLIVFIILVFIVTKNMPSKYDGFAQCLDEKKAMFYGTFWCKYCQEQKRMFGNAARLLPYEECSTPDGNSQLPYCTERGITSYPTWDFKDGSRLNGVIPFETLSEKTGCALPQ